VCVHITVHNCHKQFSTKSYNKLPSYIKRHSPFIAQTLPTEWDQRWKAAKTQSPQHTHTRLMALCLRLPRWVSTGKEKPIWILLKQETVSGSGTSWAICKCTPRSRQITMPAAYHSTFLQARCPSCRPTNSVKALKAKTTEGKCKVKLFFRVDRIDTG